MKSFIISMEIYLINYHQKVTNSFSILYIFSYLDEILEQSQSILKQCESSSNILLWTIIVKSLILFRPSLIEQYIPTVKISKKRK